jgi:hypothetical protein
MISGRNRPNETSYLNVRDLRYPYNFTTTSQGLETQNLKDTKSPKTWWYTKSSQKKNMARTRQRKQGLKCGQKQNLNVEDHIAATPTGPKKKTYPPCWHLIFHYLPSLLVGIILLSNGVWDQAYPYRHVVVCNNSLGERDYELVIIWLRWVSPTRIVSKHPCHGKLPP